MSTKIAVVGIGGVGGYYGGLLAKTYETNPDIDICFVARGAHLKAIQEKGLKVITESGEFVAQPRIATEYAAELGVVDYVIISTKSYDLESTIEQLKPCIGPNTIILPLLNGVDISERIERILPQNEVWEGCVYIVGRLNEPGVVESSGGIHDLFFGVRNSNSAQLEWMEKTMLDAGIKAQLSQDIGMIIWRKFIFISTTATLTSYFNVGFRDLLTDDIRKETTFKILNEVTALSKADGITFDFDIVESTIKHIERLPFETTSSMHSDYQAGKNTELETLTNIVIQLGKKLQVPTPTYAKVYQEMLLRSK